MISVICVLTLLTLLATIVTYFKSDGALLSTLVVFAICVVLSGFIGGGLSYFTGFYPGYSDGDRIGFVVKASTKGFIFRTNEIDMQMGSGNQASLSPHFECSVPDQKLFERINAGIGQEVKITYRQWIVLPVWMGESDYEVTKVEFIDRSMSLPTTEQPTAVQKQVRL